MKLLNSFTFSITTSITGSFLYIILDDIYNKNVNNINKYPKKIEDWRIGYFVNKGFYLGGVLGMLLMCPCKINNFLRSLNSRPKIE